MSYHQFTSDERKCLWELHRKTSAFERLLMRWEELLPLFLVNCGGIAVRKERGILSLPTKRRRHGADISATLLSRLTLS